MKLKTIKLKNVSSTNNYAVNMIRKNKTRPTIIVADNQTKGKGRYGNKRISFKGNLFMSIFFEIGLKKSIKKFTLQGCQIVRNSLEKFIKEKIEIKKPNDLLIKKKKVCGILQESLNKFDKKYLVVGIGINLIKNPSIDNYPTTNLYKLTNNKISKKKIEKEIKKIFELKLTKLYKSIK